METLSNSASFPLGLYFSRMRTHILNLYCSYVGLLRKMMRTLSGSILDMSWRQRRDLWCLVSGSFFVKFVTPAKEGLLNQAWMRLEYGEAVEVFVPGLEE